MTPLLLLIDIIMITCVTPMSLVYEIPSFVHYGHTIFET